MRFPTRALPLALLLGLALAWFSAPAQAQTSPQGLYLETFRIIAPDHPQVGDTVAVELTLVNASGHNITFHPDFGVFVGCRWNSTGDANNRDFGHEFQGFTLGTNRPLHIRAERVLDEAGTWRFWPAYNIGGLWGPFRWQERTLEVAGGPGPGMHVDVVMFPSGLLSHPSMYDGHRMMVEGCVLFVETLTIDGQEYRHVMLQDPEQPVAVLPVLCRPDVDPYPGESMRFTGTLVVNARWGCLQTEPGLDATSGPAVRVE